jgi:hypothetical protein
MGDRRLKSGLFNRYVIVGISEVFGNNHADHHSVTSALAHDCSVNYSSAPRPKRRGFKFEKKLRKGCDTIEEKTFQTLCYAVQLMPTRILPQMEIGGQTFVIGKFFSPERCIRRRSSSIISRSKSCSGCSPLLPATHRLTTSSVQVRASSSFSEEISLPRRIE